MKTFRTLIPAALVSATLVAAPFGQADPSDHYTTLGSPTLVQASAGKIYTITLTNDAGSVTSATQATVDIPSGFSVDPLSLSATTTGAAPCLASAWNATVNGVAARIELASPNNGNRALCPGSALTLRFHATAPAADGTFTWTTQLRRDTTTFTLNGADPSVVVDGTLPPAPMIDSSPPAASGSSSASFAFSDSESGVAFDCQLDAGSFSACNSPKKYVGLADGLHTFRVRARDGVGNTSTTTELSWTIDTVAPTVTLTSTPAALTNNATPSFAFAASEGGGTLSCKLDGGAFSACTSPITYPTQADGQHTFALKATDAAGNIGPEAAFVWTIDTVAPAVTLTLKPATASNDPTPSFAFSAGAVVPFLCKLDDNTFTACTSPITYPPQPDGAHTFAVQATDAAGNTGETTYSWTIDTAPPPVPILQSSPPDVTASQTARFEFGDAEPGVEYDCRLDASSFSLCTSPKDYVGPLADGPHTFRVRARDAAGNPGAATTYSWTVDTVNPVVTIAAGPAHATNQTSASFIFSANKPPAETTFECSLDSGGLAACTSAATYSSLADGTHTFRVRATYPPGNTGLATSYTWTIDTAAPPSPAIGGGPPSATNQRAATFVFADGEVGASFTCQLDSGPIASCSSPKSYGGLADGPHTFAVRAQDAVGNVSGPSAYNWTVDTVAPDTAISSGPGLDSSSASVSFTFASNEASASFACSLDGGAFSPCTSPQTYGGLADGPHTLAVRAVDAAGNVDSTPASWPWTVATPRAPDMTPPARVSRLTAAVGYRLVRLSWRLPRDPDFDHVSVFVSTNKRGPLQGSVYTGNGTTFAYKRFRNGTYYRFAVISYDRAGNHSVEARVAVTSSALLRSPRDGAVVRKPPLLSWMAVSGATYYNVQLVYGGRKILSAWPKQPRLRLWRSWRYGGAHRLKKGLYNWYVWPGLGARSAARYGQLLGHGSFVVR
jgi:large repetitive protein